MGDLLTMLAASLSGLAIAALAVPLAGGGHGWMGALWSAFAVITVPLGALAWRYRDVSAGRVIAIVVLVVDGIVDVLLIAATRDGHFAVAWRHLAPIVVAWAALWIGWQIPPALGLMVARRARRIS
jgi:hypothetical protein